VNAASRAQRPDPVIIIGAGIGGLSTAIRLAAAGVPAMVLEQSATVGGKMGELTADGFRWDTGPSVITMRHVLEELFASAGRRLGDYIELLPVDPLTRYFYPDGTQIDATRDLTRMLGQIETLASRDVEGYLSYLAHAARLHRITGPVFIYDKPPTWRSFLRVPPWEALRVDPLRTMQSGIDRHVHSPHLRQLLGRFATYVGASPYQGASALNVIAHVELAGGVWYPSGGVYTIARALYRLAEELGVRVSTSAMVEAIRVVDGRATGVVVEGTLIPAAGVVANVDVSTVYERLLPPTAGVRRRLRQLRRYEPSCSGFVLMLGVDQKYPTLAHHNIFFSANYRQEFTDIFRRGRPAADPTVYVAITSKTDVDHAPTGGENWFILVNAPATGGSFDWAREQDAYRDLVLDRLAAHGYDVRQHIVVERRLTPDDLARKTGAFRGALYGTSMNGVLAPFRRPHNRSPDVAGLYFAGGTTHPGGGVPMVMLSGKLVTDLVLQDRRRQGE
jgi:phytoene desaturase